MIRPTIEEVKLAVCAVFQCGMADMTSGHRHWIIARPRQVGMALCREFTDWSLAAIGRKFGGRDHSTVCHAIKTLVRLSDDDDFMHKIDSARRVAILLASPRRVPDPPDQGDGDDDARSISGPRAPIGPDYKPRRGPRNLSPPVAYPARRATLRRYQGNLWLR